MSGDDVDTTASPQGNERIRHGSRMRPPIGEPRKRIIFPKAYFIGKQARKHPTELETRTPATIISGKQGADLSTLT